MPSELFHGENKLIFNEMMRFALFYTNMLSWIFIVLAHWNNNPWIDMSHQSNTLSWFWTKRPTVIYKTLHRKLRIEQHKSHCELRCSGRVSSSCSTSDTCHVTVIVCFNGPNPAVISASSCKIKEKTWNTGAKLCISQTQIIYIWRCFFLLMRNISCLPSGYSREIISNKGYFIISPYF
jgi:hypothetical protein